MLKSYLFLIFLSLNTVLIGQVLQKEIDCKKSIDPDTINDLIIVHADISGQTNRDIEKGVFKVLKIDVFNSFYLIFIEKDDIRSTIYSEKCINTVGQKISVDSMYYFELICKDTLYNGICLTPIPDVTYYEKYKGYELGKLNISKNLCGLFFKETEGMPCLKK